MTAFKIKFLYFNLCIITFFSCSKAQVTSITASSSLFDKTGAYLPENLIDNNQATSWVEAKESDGIGEEIILYLSKNTNIKSIAIQNGFGKPEFWSANNRVKDIEVISENGSFTATLKDIPNEQVILPTSKFEGTRIIFRIKSVYKGNKFNDTALSEIKINDIEIAPNLLSEINQKVELLKSEAITFYGDFNKMQMKIYKDYDKCGETNKINDIINHPEKHVKIKKLSFNFAIVGSQIIYPQYGCSLIDYMQTLWKFKDGKWVNLKLPVIAYNIQIFKLNEDDIPDMILFHIVNKTLPNEAFSIFLGQIDDNFIKIYDYTAGTHTFNESITLLSGSCSNFKINCIQHDGPSDHIMTFDCKTNNIMTKRISRLKYEN